MRGQGKKKAFADRSLTNSRVRTGKKAGKPKKKPSPNYSPAVRTNPTTGRIDYDEDRQKTFTQ